MIKPGSPTSENGKVPMDLRRHPRRYTSLPMQYQMGLLESTETLDSGEMLQNLSTGGA